MHGPRECPFLKGCQKCEEILKILGFSARDPTIVNGDVSP